MITTENIFNLVATIVVGGIPTWKWWVERRDARSTVATERTDSVKTVATLKETVEQLEREALKIRSDREHYREQAQYLQERLDRLEPEKDRIHAEKVTWMERALNAESRLRAIEAST